MKKGDRYQQSYDVSPAVYQGFMGLFNDRNPLHTKDSFARQKGFEKAVMYGNILNGFLSHFIGEALPVKNVIIHTQEIKYILPVYLNDRVKLTAEVEDVFDSVKAVAFKFHFENQDGKKVAKGKIQIGLI